MGARRKRCHSNSGNDTGFQSVNDTDNRPKKKRGNSNKKLVNEETITYRILCPAGLVESVLDAINSIRKETKSIVNVMDLCPGATDRVVVMQSHVEDKKEVDVDDEFDDNEPFCGSQDALIRVHAAIAQHSHMQQKGNEECQILVPSSQLGKIIGDTGATINKLRSKTGANITVTAKNGFDPTHSCAMEFDNIVLISGNSEAVRKAVFAISAIIYKFTPSSFIPSNVPINPSDVSLIYPSVPSFFGAAPLPSLQGSAEAGNARPYFQPALPAISGFGVAPLPGLQGSAEAGNACRSPEPALPVVSGCGATPLPGLQVSAEAGNACPSIQPALPAVSACGASPLLGLQGSTEAGNACSSIQPSLPAISGCGATPLPGIQGSGEAGNACPSLQSALPAVSGSDAIPGSALEPVVIKFREEVLKDIGSDSNISGPSQNLETDVPSNAVGKVMDQEVNNLTNSKKKFKGKKKKSTAGLKDNEPLPPSSNLKTDIPGNAVEKCMDQGRENLTNSQKKSKRKKRKSTVGSKDNEPLPPPLNLETDIPGNAVGKGMNQGQENLTNSQKKSKGKKRKSTVGLKDDEPLPPLSNLETDVLGNAVGKGMDQGQENLTNSQKKSKRKKKKSKIGLKDNEPLPPPSNLQTSVPGSAVGKDMDQGRENLTNSQKKSKRKKKKSTVGLKDNESVTRSCQKILIPQSVVKRVTGRGANLKKLQQKSKKMKNMSKVGNGMDQGRKNLTNSKKKSEKNIISELGLEDNKRVTRQSCHNILIPQSVVKRVTGPGGANLEKLQQITGAGIDIQDSLDGNSIAFLTGTPDQRKEAETLVRAYIITM